MGAQMENELTQWTATTDDDDYEDLYEDPWVGLDAADAKLLQRASFKEKDAKLSLSLLQFAEAITDPKTHEDLWKAVELGCIKYLSADELRRVVKEEKKFGCDLSSWLHGKARQDPYSEEAELLREIEKLGLKWPTTTRGMKPEKPRAKQNKE